MFDLKIVSALEIKIVIDHVCGYLDETGAEQSQEEGCEVEDMGDLKCDYSTENYWDEGCLEEWYAHRFEP